MESNYQKIVKLGLGTGDKGIFKQPNIKFYYEKLQMDKMGNPTGGVASVCVIAVPARLLNEAQAAETEKHLPVSTAILPMDADLPPVYVRGLSFCVPKDQFNKKEGRDGALGRAIQAVERQVNTNPILKRATALLAKSPSTAGFTHYSEFNVNLTPKEKALFNISMENNG
jgi:hypothetical protein